MSRSNFLKAVAIGALVGGITGFIKGCYKVIARNKAKFEQDKLDCYGQLMKVVQLTETVNDVNDGKYMEFAVELEELQIRMKAAKNYKDLDRVSTDLQVLAHKYLTEC